MGKRATSVRITKEEKERAYKPKNMVDKRDNSKLRVYDAGDVDRLRKKQLKDEIEAAKVENIATSTNDKRKAKSKAEIAAREERKAKQLVVQSKNEAEGVVGFVMPVPQALASVSNYEDKRQAGETVVNVTGKRRLSLLLMDNKPWYYNILNGVCILGIVLAIVLVIMLTVGNEVDEDQAKGGSEGARRLRGLFALA
jgi:hypothetical protein